MYLRLIFLALIVWLTSSKPPQLTPRDARIKIEEILSAHVHFHELSPQLIRRALTNYLDEIDPFKIYLTAPEISRWADPSDELLEQVVQAIHKEDFSEFEQLHRTIEPSFARHLDIEDRIRQMQLPAKVPPIDCKKLTWAVDEQELTDRLLHIRALQLEAAAKLDPQTQSQFMKRLQKRRLKREEEICVSSPKKRQRVILALVLKSISSALDSQTAYFTPAEANQFMIQVQQRLFGIGAQLRDDLNGFTFVRLLEGGPAKESGKLRVGDQIIAVDGEPVVGMDIIEAVELIRGVKGSKVNLTILRTSEGDGGQRKERLDVSITRKEVILKETRIDKSYEPFGDGVIGVLHLFSFYQDSTTSSAKDIQMAINELKKDHNLKGIVLDLRNNAGGLLPQAVAVTGLFIKKGIVVSVKDNTGTIQHLRNIDGTVTWDGPLVVLTNKASASAAEIVAQTLQDYGRALLVGDEMTYGKGTFQTFTLEAASYGRINPKGEFKVTRGRYYTVSGKSPQLVGVRPDIIVPGIYSKLEIGEQYSKFPLENNAILPNFEDDLSDIPPMHRNQIVRLYKFDLQPILDTYTPYMEMLQKNSTQRIQLSQVYQDFIKEISRSDLLAEMAESYGQFDLQLVETCNIIKDLILLMQQQSVPANSPQSARAA